MNDFMIILILLVFGVGCVVTITALGLGFNDLITSVGEKGRQARQREQLRRQQDEITNIKFGAIRDMDALSRQTVDAARKLYDGSQQDGWR